MSQTESLLRHYHEVRTRLRCPPNAVPDTEIDLKRKKGVAAPPIPEFLPPTLPEPIQTPQPIRGSLSASFPPESGFAAILTFVGHNFGLTGRQVREHRRFQHVTLPRYVAVYLAIKHTNRSVASMGRYLGLDHTTLLHGRNALIKKMVLDRKLFDKIKAIEVSLLVYLAQSALSAQLQRTLEIEPGKGPQVGKIYSVDNSGRRIGNGSKAWASKED